MSDDYLENDVQFMLLGLTDAGDAGLGWHIARLVIARIQHGQADELAEARRERDLLREFMRDVCAALKCEQNDEATMLAIDELRGALEEIIRRESKAWKPMRVFRSDEEVALDEARHEAWTEAADIARAALEGKP